MFFGSTWFAAHRTARGLQLESIQKAKSGDIITNIFGADGFGGEYIFEAAGVKVVCTFQFNVRLSLQVT